MPLVEHDNGDIQITTVVAEVDVSEMSDFYHRLQECQRRTNHPFRNIEAMTVLPWAASPYRMNRDIIAGFLVVIFILYLLISVFWRTIVSENHNPLVVSVIVAACLTPFLAVHFQCFWLKINLTNKINKIATKSHFNFFIKLFVFLRPKCRFYINQVTT